jgi:PST family polysaccharide transporter
MFAFGGNMTAFNLVNYWACNGDNLLIGRFWGAHELGVYSRAYQLLLWPVAQLTSPISAVVVPALSRLNRQPAKWASFFLQSLRVCIFLTVPLCVFLALEADAAVLLVLGKRWGEAIPVFRLLAVAAVIHPMLAATGWVYISLGETRRLFRVGLCAAVWFVASFVVGLPYGARGVALAYSISVALAIVPLLVAMCRGTPLSVVAVLRTVLPYFTSAAIAACCVYLLECRFVPSEIPHISRIALSGGLFGIIYLALVSLSSRETRDLIRAAPITLVRALHS